MIADEAYEDLVYDGEHVSIASLPGMAERTISAYTFSKTYAMTGWRIGYAVAHEPFMTAMRKLVLYSTNGVPTMVQWAAVEALSLSPDHRKKRLAEYRERRDALVGGLNAIGFDCEMPAGAFYAFPSVIRLSSDSRKAAASVTREGACCHHSGCGIWQPGRGARALQLFDDDGGRFEQGLEALRRLT